MSRNPLKLRLWPGGGRSGLRQRGGECAAAAPARPGGGGRGAVPGGSAPGPGICARWALHVSAPAAGGPGQVVFPSHQSPLFLCLILRCLWLQMCLSKLGHVPKRDNVVPQQLKHAFSLDTCCVMLHSLSCWDLRGSAHAQLAHFFALPHLPPGLARSILAPTATRACWTKTLPAAGALTGVHGAHYGQLLPEALTPACNGVLGSAHMLGVLAA